MQIDQNLEGTLTTCITQSVANIYNTLPYASYICVQTVKFVLDDQLSSMSLTCCIIHFYLVITLDHSVHAQGKLIAVFPRCIFRWKIVMFVMHLKWIHDVSLFFIITSLCGLCFMFIEEMQSAKRDWDTLHREMNDRAHSLLELYYNSSFVYLRIGLEEDEQLSLMIYEKKTSCVVGVIMLLNAFKPLLLIKWLYFTFTDSQCLKICSLLHTAFC